MIKVEFKTRNKTTGEEHFETATVTSLETAKEELQKILEEFNRVEKQRYGNKAQLRELVIVDTGQQGQPQHEWRKKNLVGQEDKYGIYDLWACENCGVSIKIRSLGGVPRGGDCFPERTCRYCNRVFASEKNLQRHMYEKHEQ